MTSPPLPVSSQRWQRCLIKNKITAARMKRFVGAVFNTVFEKVSDLM